MWLLAQYNKPGGLIAWQTICRKYEEVAVSACEFIPRWLLMNSAADVTLKRSRKMRMQSCTSPPHTRAEYRESRCKGLSVDELLFKSSGSNIGLTLPYLTFGVGRLLHLPSAEAVSVRPNAQPRCNQKVTVIGFEAETSAVRPKSAVKPNKSPATWDWWRVVWLFLSGSLRLVSSSPSD